MALVLVARWTAREGEEGRVADALRRLTPASRAEPGCSYYQPCRSKDDPREFLIFEIYDDEDAVKAHGESEHFQTIGLPAIELLERRERLFYEPLDA